MPFEKITVDDLRKDQERLKAELEKLETSFDKKKKKPPIKKPPKVVKIMPIGQEPDALLKQHLQENHKLMEKFDYMIDVLLTSSDDSEEEELQKIVYMLAQTQEHALQVLTNVNEIVQKTEQEVSSKEELEKFEEEQRKRYKDLNNKMNLLMERVEKPAYLKELDAIRVGVSNILSELKRLEDRGTRSDEVRVKAEGLTKQVDQVEQTVKQAPEVAQSPEVQKEVGDMSVQVNELEESLKKLAKDKKSGIIDVSKL